MDGIVFFGSREHDAVVSFYRELGATVWREQPDCTILAVGDFRFGFCARDRADTDGTVTFVFPEREGVDDAYRSVGSLDPDAPETEPAYSETYDIYHAYATDPEGRTVEFQTFEA